MIKFGAGYVIVIAQLTVNALGDEDWLESSKTEYDTGS